MSGLQNLESIENIESVKLYSIDLPDSNAIDMLGAPQGLMTPASDKAFTSIANVQPQGIVEITIDSAFVIDFSGLTGLADLGTVTPVEGTNTYVFKVKNISTTVTPSYAISDGVHGGSVPNKIVRDDFPTGASDASGLLSVSNTDPSIMTVSNVANQLTFDIIDPDTTTTDTRRNAVTAIESFKGDVSVEVDYISHDRIGYAQAALSLYKKDSNTTFCRLQNLQNGGIQMLLTTEASGTVGTFNDPAIDPYGKRWKITRSIENTNYRFRFFYKDLSLDLGWIEMNPSSRYICAIDEMGTVVETRIFTTQSWVGGIAGSIKFDNLEFYNYIDNSNTNVIDDSSDSTSKTLSSAYIKANFVSI